MTAKKLQIKYKLKHVIIRDDDCFEVESFFLLNILSFVLGFGEILSLNIINGENIYNVRTL